jgi:serine/threonine protein kinase
MGLEISTANEKNSRIKKISIKTAEKTVIFHDVPREITVTGLLSQVNNKLNDLRRPVISLMTSDKSECLNYYLSLPERNLTPLQNEEILHAVYFSRAPSKVSISSFDVIQMIGRGAYSVVTQVRKKDTGMIYAMKSIEKKKIIQEKLQPHLMAEKEILSTVRSPFIAKLHWAFQTRNKLHLVMDFYPGGELYYHLKNIRQFSENHARFYFAEILLGLRSLHRKEIAYRDLKPENIVIDVDGHARLTDFGLSRLDMYENSMSFCGSPEYMSPEILMGEGHSKVVDFYCLGALLYEMLVGLPPFYDRDPHKMHNRVLNEDVSLPENLTVECQDILKGLLAKDPCERLGANGPREIMKHPWCKDLSWKEIKKKSIKPPLQLDLRKSYFDRRVLNSPLGFLSDTESNDNDFLMFDYNLDSSHDDISKIYFEGRGGLRSYSQKTNRLSLNKKLECYSGLSTQVSPFLSPVNSLNSSYLGSDSSIFNESVKLPKNFARTGILKISEKTPSRKSITTFNSPRSDKFGNILKNSVFGFFSTKK